MCRILQVISDGNVGGAGILLSHVTEALRGEFDFEILVPEGSSLIDRLPSRGVRVTPLSFSPDRSFSLRDVPTLLRYMRSVRPSVIHTHASLTARLAGHLLGVGALLSTRHCAIGAALRPMSALKRRLYEVCTTLTVATARAAARELIESGVREERIVTVENGVPPLSPLAERERLEALRALGLQPSHLILGSCARLEHVKGQDLLLRALAQLLPHFPHARALIVGDGSCRASLETLAAALGIRHAVRFVGYTHDPARYERLFTVNVNTSRGTETSCLVTSECMSVGIPTVASDFGGNRDMIREGENGFLFRTDDLPSLVRTLTPLLATPSRLSDMRKSTVGVYRARYSLERMAEGYRRLYSSLVRA